MKWFTASGHVNGGVSGLLRAETRDEQAGQNLRDVVQGFLALARMQAGNKPEMQALVSSLQVSGTGQHGGPELLAADRSHRGHWRRGRRGAQERRRSVSTERNAR